MKFNQDRINQLRNGVTAIKNENGTLDQLKAILKEAFPEDKAKIHGDTIYYYSYNDKLWAAVDGTIPTRIENIYHISGFFTKETVVNRFPYRLSINDAKRIIEKACHSWQQRLANRWALNLVLNDEVLVTENEYNEMRKHCTKAQHALFDDIFGSDEKSPYKDGELIFVKVVQSGDWKLRYATGTMVNGAVIVYANQNKQGTSIKAYSHAPATGITLPD
jgi:hypothetical protein